jgi:poly(A) polymerase
LRQPPDLSGYNPAMPGNRLERTLEKLRNATASEEYAGNLWLVGGYVRDKLLGIEQDGDDIDIVLEGSSADLAAELDNAGITEHAPVTYPRFGTAMVTIDGVSVELVTARRESYAAGSRKPDQVEPATIAEDAHRRDFTINTLLENLHTGDIVDPLGAGRRDLENGVIRTPLPPGETFTDDPLRMLRAVRFAARFDFKIDAAAWSAITEKSDLLTSTVSSERIRDEFNKVLLGNNPANGLALLLGSTLLERFAPELTAMVGVTQNEFHNQPVWEHTLTALTNLIRNRPDAPLLLRLAMLLHDCGKPATRTVGQDGRVHFYGHEDIGASIAREFLYRLKFSHADIDKVTSLVALHMRIGEYKPDEWTDAAVRRFVRAAGPLLEWLFEIHRSDVAALGPMFQDMTRANLLRERIAHLQSTHDALTMESPLSGVEIIAILGLAPGPEVGQIKAALTDAVVEGRLNPLDKEAAATLARDLFVRKV